MTDDARTATAHETVQGGDVVELRLPADGAYLSVLRTATAGLAARLDFTLDEIEDLRIAVDEACALLLPDAEPGSAMTCVFALTDHTLAVTVTVPSPPSTPISYTRAGQRLTHICATSFGTRRSMRMWFGWSSRVLFPDAKTDESLSNVSVPSGVG